MFPSSIKDRSNVQPGEVEIYDLLQLLPDNCYVFWNIKQRDVYPVPYYRP